MVTAGLWRKRPCMISPSVRLTQASADQRTDALAARVDEMCGDGVQAVLARAELAGEPRLDADEIFLDRRWERRRRGGRGAVGEGLHGRGEATQRERTSNVKDGRRNVAFPRGRG